MDLKTFLKIAQDMRAVQKEFFATPPDRRRPNLAFIAKRAEQRFDRALDEMGGGRLSLFEERDDSCYSDY